VAGFTFIVALMFVFGSASRILCTDVAVNVCRRKDA